MRHFKTVLLLLCLGAILHLMPSKQTLRVCGDLSETTETILVSSGLKVTSHEFTTQIDIDDRDEVLEALSKAMYACKVQQDLIDSNIANNATTKTVHGEPYRRQSLSCSSDGSIFVEEETGDYNWIYDPSHPDAAKDGPKSGYVATPNINVINERIHKKACQNEEETLRAMMNHLNPDFIVPTRPQFLLKDCPVVEIPPLPASDDLLEMLAGIHLLKSDLSDFQPLAQTNAISDGQTCVAMCINELTGSDLNADDVDEHYGFQLLEALNKECRPAGFRWSDAGDISDKSRTLVQAKINLGLPVIVALNGPEFSPSGLGGIKTLIAYDGETFSYADPANGKIMTTTWSKLVEAPSHPDGNFLFVADKLLTSPAIDFGVKLGDVGRAVFSVKEVEVTETGHGLRIASGDLNDAYEALKGTLGCTEILEEHIELRLSILRKPASPKPPASAGALELAGYSMDAEFRSQTNVSSEQRRLKLLKEERAGVKEMLRQIETHINFSREQTETLDFGRVLEQLGRQDSVLAKPYDR